MARMTPQEQEVYEREIQRRERLSRYTLVAVLVLIGLAWTMDSYVALVSYGGTSIWMVALLYNVLAYRSSTQSKLYLILVFIGIFLLNTWTYYISYLEQR